MSTISGIILGIATAAAVTVFYGDTLNAKLEHLLRSADVSVNAAAAALKPAEDALPQKPQAPATEPSAAQFPAGDEPVVAEQPDAVLARKWREFASQSDQLQALGEYQWRNCFQRAAAAYEVSEPLLLAVASGESSFDATARSNKDAIGLMQIRWPETARHLGIGREADLYDPCTNVAAGARYLAELSARYQNDLHRAIAAYNYGPSRVDEGPLPPGAQWYSQYIYQHLQQVLGRPHVPGSELLPSAEYGAGGYQVLMSFSQPFRARDFMEFLQARQPGISLARRNEALGRYEVVLLYEDSADRQRALEAIERSGFVALD